MPGVAPTAVDAHQHVWDPTRADYPWMTPALDRLRRPFDHADVVAEQTEVGSAPPCSSRLDSPVLEVSWLMITAGHPG